MSLEEGPGCDNCILVRYKRSDETIFCVLKGQAEDVTLATVAEINLTQPQRIPVELCDNPGKYSPVD